MEYVIEFEPRIFLQPDNSRADSLKTAKRFGTISEASDFLLLTRHRGKIVSYHEKRLEEAEALLAYIADQLPLLRYVSAPGQAPLATRQKIIDYFLAK